MFKLKGIFMQKKWLFVLFCLLAVPSVDAKVSDFDHYFVVDMKMELPDPKEYLQKLNDQSKVYDKGYTSRYKIGNKFKKEFSRTIKAYGQSEGRIKNSYEEDLLEVISWLPKSAYQYIGPMLHEVPGMSEKILNLPGIKETKNKFPEDIAERFKADKNLEFISPALYFLLMPEIWDEAEPENLDKPTNRPAKKPYVDIELPDYLKQKIGLPLKTAEKKPASAIKKATSKIGLSLRTLNPTLTSPLTTKDVEAFVATVDDIMAWGNKDDGRIFYKLIIGEALLDSWEEENGTSLKQNSLKDIVNPCQRLVLKVRLAGVYNEFSSIVVKKGFSPEEWAYTCDKTIKAFRVAEASPAVADAVRFHRRGYYDKYIERLPEKWRREMYAAQAALIKMYAVFKEDVETVRPFHKELSRKFIKSNGVMLTAPIFY